jgi:hypothetical protein
MTETQVITGPVMANRSVLTPEDQPNYSVAENKAMAPRLGRETYLPRTFRSTISDLRIHRWSVLDSYNEFKVRQPGGESYIQFRQGRFIAKDIGDVLIIESVDNYGIEIFDVDAEVRTIQESKTKFVLEGVLSSPEVQQRLGEVLGIKDFTDLFQKKERIEEPVDKAAALEAQLAASMAMIAKMQKDLELIRSVPPEPPLGVDIVPEDEPETP